MLQFLYQLPCETLGHNMLGFLELVDIIQFEKAAASQESQQLLRAILPYCPPIVVSDSWNSLKFNHIVCHWLSNRRCRVQLRKISIESLCEMSLEHSILYDITLCLKKKASLKDIASLSDLNIRDRITELEIESDQDPAVMKVLFALLDKSSIRSLSIQYSNPFRWMEHIKKIGPCLRKLNIGDSESLKVFKAVVEYCPYLEKLSLTNLLETADCNILQRIANNCPHLRSLAMWLDYFSDTEADADLTAFAEKCPQLEELSLNCRQLTDQSVIALAQHCSRLKKLKLNQYKLTSASLIALSERGLPLEELYIIPRIPIPSAEIAAQCAHALSRIRNFETYSSSNYIKYMTWLRQLELNCSEDHLLVPHLLLLLQGQCCAGLESLAIGSDCSITFSESIEVSMQLCTQTIYNPTCSSDAVLVELARSCPHLQRVTLDSSEVTEEGVLALTAHCRQLREIHILYTTLTKETVRQLAQHCPRLTELYVREKEWNAMVGNYRQYSIKEIRALRLMIHDSCIVL